VRRLTLRAVSLNKKSRNPRAVKGLLQEKNRCYQHKVVQQYSWHTGSDVGVGAPITAGLCSGSFTTTRLSNFGVAGFHTNTQREHA
jgi:hypothetical protein